MPRAQNRAASSCSVKLKTLADATRLEVMRILLDGPKTVAGINLALHIEQSLLSHHLKVLRDAGLVESTRKGKGVQYRLATPVSGASVIELGCCQLSFDDETSPKKNKGPRPRLRVRK